MEHFPSDVIATIGLYLDHASRNSCVLAHPCFHAVHRFCHTQTWTISHNPEIDLLKKFAALKNFKPHIKEIEIWLMECSDKILDQLVEIANFGILITLTLYEVEFATRALALGKIHVNLNIVFQAGKKELDIFFTSPNYDTCVQAITFHVSGAYKNNDLANVLAKTPKVIVTGEIAEFIKRLPYGLHDPGLNEFRTATHIVHTGPSITEIKFKLCPLYKQCSRLRNITFYGLDLELCCRGIAYELDASIHPDCKLTFGSNMFYSPMLNVFVKQLKAIRPSRQIEFNVNFHDPTCIMAIGAALNYAHCSKLVRCSPSESILVSSYNDLLNMLAIKDPSMHTIWSMIVHPT